LFEYIFPTSILLRPIVLVILVIGISPQRSLVLPSLLNNLLAFPMILLIDMIQLGLSLPFLLLFFCVVRGRTFPRFEELVEDGVVDFLAVFGVFLE